VRSVRRDYRALIGAFLRPIPPKRALLLSAVESCLLPGVSPRPLYQRAWRVAEKKFLTIQQELEQKRQKVRDALANPKNKHKSDRQIARENKCSQPFVGKMRRLVEAETRNKSQHPAVITENTIEHKRTRSTLRPRGCAPPHFIACGPDNAPGNRSQLITIGGSRGVENGDNAVNKSEPLADDHATVGRRRLVGYPSALDLDRPVAQIGDVEWRRRFPWLGKVVRGPSRVVPTDADNDQSVCDFDPFRD
jgi:hypothetical protein